MYTYSIMPLDVEHLDEICEDVKYQYEKNIATCPLFIMYLHPEGNPPIEKVTAQCEKYKLFREKLDKMGVPSGVLIQSAMGHGGAFNMGASFTTITRMDTGENINVYCPYDKGFQDYFREAMKTLASYHPKAIMLDDDCRMLHWRGGCACEHHLEEFNKRAKTNMNREELHDYVMNHNDQDPITKLYVETQEEAIWEFLTAAREGIDAVDPTIQGINCISLEYFDGMEKRNKIFAGKNNTTIVRLPTGTYAPISARTFSDIMFRFAAGKANLKGRIENLLVETDTVPFNRYAKAASYLHGHFAAGLLEGGNGAKHWITRLTAYEPDSGKAYRKVLADNAGMFEEITKFAKDIHWVGACVPFGLLDSFHFSDFDFQNHDWVMCVLERMGIPFYFSESPDSTAFINGNGDYTLSDEKLNEIFENCSVFLSSDSAQSLIDRGFQDKIGVTVRKWTGKTLSGEIFENGNRTGVQAKVKELCPTNDKVYASSYVFHLENNTDKEFLFPGVAVYPRENGKLTVTYSGTPRTPFNYYMGAFSFLAESRKEQFIELLKKANSLPIYYKGDGELCLRAGTLPNGEMIAAAWNLGIDVLDELTYVTEKPVKKVEILTATGKRKKIKFKAKGNEFTISQEIRPMVPYILFLSF